MTTEAPNILQKSINPGSHDGPLQKATGSSTPSKHDICLEASSTTNRIHPKPNRTLAAGLSDVAMPSKPRKMDLPRRTKLHQWNTFDDAVELLQLCSNIIVLTGAGISTSLGIPDFRSKENGLYTQLAKKGIYDLDDPQEVFSIETFCRDPGIFYDIAKGLQPPVCPDGTPKFTPTHTFIRILQDQNKLLTNYTQNIDGLELVAGVYREKLLQAHGSMASGTCMRCGKKYCKNFRAVLRSGLVPKCHKCVPPPGKRKHSADSKPRKRRRKEWEDSTDESDEAEDRMLIAEGVIRPNMTFFGERVDASYYDRLDADKHAVDLIIIIGTSLVVEPLASLPLDTTIAKVPQIYISKSPCPASRLPDIELLGECDLIVEALARRAGWKLQHNMMLEDGAEVRVETLEGYEHKHLVRRLTKVPNNAKTHDLGLASGSRATPPISQP